MGAAPIDEVDDAGATLEGSKVEPTVGLSLKPPSVLLEGVPLNHQSKDLLMRLLEAKPECRLRSIFQLQRIAMFMGFSFEDVRKKKVSLPGNSMGAFR